MKKPLLMITAIGIILDEDNKSWIENNHFATFEMIRVDNPPL